jgi:hypothetical protein
VCYSRKSVFRVLGIYNFDVRYHVRKIYYLFYFALESIKKPPSKVAYYKFIQGKVSLFLINIRISSDEFNFFYGFQHVPNMIAIDL